VIRVGDLPTSKPLRAWLSDLAGTPQVALDPQAAWQDPDSVLTHSFALDPADVLPVLESPTHTQDDWLSRWRAADQLAAQAILRALEHDQLSEPLLASELGVLLASEATLFVASSMPVRDIESFWPIREDPPRVLCNRGANGIDGTVSSAFGAAASGNGPVLLLIGDVALAHDIGGLLAAGRLDLELTIVLIDNGGGGIFDFLSVASEQMALEQDHYSTHIATPTGLEFARAAELYGLAHESVNDLPGLRSALERALGRPGCQIIQVKTERGHNVALHHRLWRAVGEAIAGQDPGAPAPRAPDSGAAGEQHHG
jgi:2-succinyl-5-enolpyruvyl-6-hydroxy-3-cyclohexene-1-carboxylate synthase